MSAVPLDGEGQAGQPREFVRIDPLHGNPDGVTLDAQGNLWVALWGGWCVRCYAPDGALLDEVGLPAANITKIAFGGPEMRTAFTTSARIGLTRDELEMQPLAGSLFAFDVAVPGRALPSAQVGSRGVSIEAASASSSQS